MSPPRPFTLYPALPLRRGEVVGARHGPGGSGRLDEVAERFSEAGATWVHVTDLDAAEGGRNQWTRIPQILAARGLRVQFGGGVRSMTQAQQLLDVGVERVVVGTQAALHPEWALELAKVFPGRIAIALDLRAGRVLVKARTEEAAADPGGLLRRLDRAGLAAFVVQDADDRPVGDGALAALRDAASDTPLVVGGGVDSMAELERIARAGAAGAIVGAAALDGRLDLAEALRRWPPPRRAGPIELVRGREEER
jgi:phosphoribosylformimino-5-aminoimidazole carboxamide ribotide isomerase